MTANAAFMELVQAHERGWGMEQYLGRPTLVEMLNSPVVVLWSGEDKTGKGRFTISVHQRVDELNELLLGMVLAGKVTASSNRRLARIFVKQQAVKITGVRLVVEGVNDGK